MSQSTVFILISAVVLLLWVINTLIYRKSIVRKILNVVLVVAVVVLLVTVL